jgi:hypothetical protein
MCLGEIATGKHTKIEKENTILVLCLTRLGLKHTICCIGGKQINHYTTDAVFSLYEKCEYPKGVIQSRKSSL